MTGAKYGEVSSIFWNFEMVLVCDGLLLVRKQRKKVNVGVWGRLERPRLIEQIAVAADDKFQFMLLNKTLLCLSVHYFGSP